MEPERAQQNKSFLNKNFVFVTFCLGIVGFQNFCFFHCFYIVPTSKKLREKQKIDRRIQTQNFAILPVGLKNGVRVKLFKISRFGINQINELSEI